MKKIPLIDLTPVHRKLEGRVMKAFRSVYRQNAFVLGEDVKFFEEEFAASCGAAYGVGVSSGTAALALALRALGVGPGDEVITTPFTFYATAAAVVFVGATPRFVDVDPNTLNMDPLQLEKARTPWTKAILPVHIFGQPADMGGILSFARLHNFRVLEDACQSHGATFDGKPVGALGDAGCFSFYPTKNLGGVGDGGMVVTNSESMAEKLRMLRNCGRSSTPRANYDHLELGYNERLDTLQAAALRIKLEYLDAWTKERQHLAEIYRRELEGCPARPLEFHPKAQSAYHLFTVRAPQRDALQAHLAKLDIGSGVFYPAPLHLQKSFESFKYKPGDFPEAERASREVLSLPLYPGLAPAAARRVAKVVRKFYG